MSFISRFAIGLLACSGTLLAAEPVSQRPYRIDDRFAREEVETDSLAFSPDGQSIAFVRRRAALSQISNGLLIEETRDDIWMQEASGKPARNLTNGATDGSGWWNPQWSADGSRLAFLSTRGGDVALWTWDRSSDRVRQVSTQGVDFARATSSGVDVGRGVFYGRSKYLAAFRWIDDRRVLLYALPEGERSTLMGSDGKHAERAVAAWARAAKGEVTASVVDSLEFRFPPRRLLLIDVMSGQERTVATTQSGSMRGLVDYSTLWWLSPDSRTVAFVPPVSARYQAFEQSALGHLWPIELRFLDGRAPRLDKALPSNLITQTLSWSPDGRFLAFFAYAAAPINAELLYGEEGAKAVVHERVESRENPARLWRVNVDAGRVEEIDTGDIDLGQGLKPPNFTWTASGDLLFHAPRRRSNRLARAKPEWLVLSREGRTRPLVRNAATMPASLQAVDSGAAFIGLAEGEVWRIDAARGTMRNLTAQFVPHVSRIIYPIDGNDSAVVVSAGEPKDFAEKFYVEAGFPRPLDADYILNLRTGETSALTAPAPNAALAAFSSKSSSAVYVANDRNGTYLWRGGAGVRADLLVETNTFLKQVAKGQRKLIDYTTLNGEKMKALLVLPPDYLPDRRYPLVMDFDIGSTPQSCLCFYSADSDVPHEVEDGFAAGGYVYMYASWPSSSMDDAGRANLLLGTQGVLPAVDEAIRLGIADPDRLFLYGMSSAGFGAFGLVTQTSRFKAAVAAFGWVDQVSHQLVADPHLRYTENPFDGAWRGPVYSSHHLLPFWLNADHLRRNSPLNYVDRVRTPLMIIQSDLDISDITQPEMFFQALIMQRKPARFVRYWGEGHGNQTPANARDEFQRILAWYDEYGDISRDAAGHMIFEGDRVKSRNGAPALKPEDFARFGPAAHTP